MRAEALSLVVCAGAVFQRTVIEAAVVCRSRRGAPGCGGSMMVVMLVCVWPRVCASRAMVVAPASISIGHADATVPNDAAIATASTIFFMNLPRFSNYYCSIAARKVVRLLSRSSARMTGIYLGLCNHFRPSVSLS